jgi:hypothetical protein
MDLYSKYQSKIDKINPPFTMPADFATTSPVSTPKNFCGPSS